MKKQYLKSIHFIVKCFNHTRKSTDKEATTKASMMEVFKYQLDGIHQVMLYDTNTTNEDVRRYWKLSNLMDNAIDEIWHTEK